MTSQEGVRHEGTIGREGQGWTAEPHSTSARSNVQGGQQSSSLWTKAGTHGDWGSWVFTVWESASPRLGGPISSASNGDLTMALVISQRD